MLFLLFRRKLALLNSKHKHVLTFDARRNGGIFIEGRFKTTRILSSPSS